MLEGVRTGIKTVTVATPILGTGIAFLVGTTPARGAGLISRGLGGAIAAGMVAAAWEFTLNSKDPPEIKTEVIMGSAGIGGIAGIVGPMVFGR
jgi:hypothetical protein